MDDQAEQLRADRRRGPHRRARRYPIDSGQILPSLPVPGVSRDANRKAGEDRLDPALLTFAPLCLPTPFGFEVHPFFHTLAPDFLRFDQAPVQDLVGHEPRRLLGLGRTVAPGRNPKAQARRNRFARARDIIRQPRRRVFIASQSSGPDSAASRRASRGSG